MLEFLRRTRSNEFVRNNVMFFVGALLVGALNYLYYPIIGRLLAPTSFGEVQTLVSMFLQLTAFLNALSLITVTIIVNSKDDARTHRTVVDLEKSAVLVSLVLLVATIVLLPWLTAFFQFEEGLPFIALALALVVSVPFTFRSAYLRGKKQFGQVTIANLLLAGGKLALSVLFVLVGLSTLGAILGLVGAQLFALGYALYRAHKVGLLPIGMKAYAFRAPVLRRLLPQLRHALLVLVVSLVITLQYSIDILIVKHFFDPAVAGLYAGIAAVARILFFLTASVAQVMLPSITLHDQNKQNHQLLYKSTLLLIGLSSPVLLACVFVPGLVTNALMGSEYNAYSDLLPPLATAVFVVALLNLFMSYFVALKRFSIAAVAIIGGATTVGLMLSSHHSLHAVVGSLLLGSIITMCLLAVWCGSARLKARYL